MDSFPASVQRLGGHATLLLCDSSSVVVELLRNALGLKLDKGLPLLDQVAPSCRARAIEFYQEVVAGGAVSPVKLAFADGASGELLVSGVLGEQGPPLRGAAGGVSEGPPLRGAAGGVSEVLLLITRTEKEMSAASHVLLAFAASSAASARKARDELRFEREQAAAERLRLRAFEGGIFRTLGQASNTEELLTASIAAIREHLGAALARIWVLRRDEGVLELRASAGPAPDMQGRDRLIPLGQYPVGQIASTAESSLNNAFSTSEDTLAPEWARREGIVGFAGCPMEVDSEVIGVAALFSRQAVAESDLEALQTVARACAQGLARLEAVDALRSTQTQLRRMMEGSNDGYWDWHVPTGALLHNPLLTEMLGYERSEIPQTLEGLTALIHADDAPRVSQLIADCFAGERPKFEIEFRMRTRPGGWMWVLSRGKVLSWVGPSQPEWMSGTHTDVEMRHRAEEARKKSRKRRK